MSNHNLALNQALSSNKVSINGGGMGVGNNVVGRVNVGVPVYNTPSFTAGIGAGSNFGRNVPSNPSVGVGFRFKF